jgi:hypothetical protein
MALSAAMRAALKRPGDVHALLTLTLPAEAGGAMRIATGEVPSASLGRFAARILSISRVRWECSGRTGEVPLPSCTVEVDDTSTDSRTVGPFARATEQADVEGSPALIQWAAPAPMLVSDWSTRFTGILHDFDRSGPNRYRLVLRVDDSWLNGPMPAARLAPAEWPAAASNPQGSASTSANVLGRAAPWVYGETDSVGLGSHGLRRCLYVHTAGPPFRYLHSIGDVPVPAVYVDGVPTATGWTRSVVLRGGRLWTLIDFTTNQAEKVVTVDSDGIQLGSYGTATNPANQLRHVLESFDRWNGEATQVTATRTDAAAFAALASFFTTHDMEHATQIGGDARSLTARQVLSAWLKQYPVAAYWTREGKLAVVPWRWYSEASGDIYPSEVSIEGVQTVAPMELKRESASVIKAVACRYLLGPDGEPLAALRAVHPADTAATVEELRADYTGRVS